MNLFKIMGVSLLATLVIEIVGALFIGIRSKKDLINVLIVNIMTNPLVVSIAFMINLRHGLIMKRIAMIILEFLAFFSEGFVYKRVLEYKRMNGYIVSLVLNVTSYLLGIIVNMVIW